MRSWDILILDYVCQRRTMCLLNLTTISMVETVDNSKKKIFNENVLDWLIVNYLLWRRVMFV